MDSRVRVALGSFLIGVLVASVFASSASAHWNRNFNRDGHYYLANFATEFRLDPNVTSAEGAANNNHTVCVVDVNEGFFRGPNWRYQAYPPGFDCGTVWDFHFSHTGGNERHCAVGNIWDETSQACVVGGKCLAFDGVTTDYISTVAGEPFVNVFNDAVGLSCLQVRQTSSVNGSCFDVQYKASAWEASDHDEWSTLNDSAGNEEIGTTITLPGATCPGEADPVWPGAAPGGPPPPDPVAACPVGFDNFHSWPYDGGLGNDADNICTASGCRADIVGVTVCSPAAGWCVGDVNYTGAFCDGTEDYMTGSDGGIDIPGSGLGSVEGVLNKIHTRQAQQMIATAVGDAATVAAIIASGAGVESAIEDGHDFTDIVEDEPGQDGFDDGIETLNANLGTDMDGVISALSDPNDFTDTTVVGDTLASVFNIDYGCTDIILDAFGQNVTIECSAASQLRDLISWIARIFFVIAMFNLVTARPPK